MQSILLIVALLWGAPVAGLSSLRGELRAGSAASSPSAILDDLTSPRPTAAMDFGSRGRHPLYREHSRNAYATLGTMLLPGDRGRFELLGLNLLSVPLGARDPYRDAARAPPA